MQVPWRQLEAQQLLRRLKGVLLSGAAAGQPVPAWEQPPVLLKQKVLVVLRQGLL